MDLRLFCFVCFVWPRKERKRTAERQWKHYGPVFWSLSFDFVGPLPTYLTSQNVRKRLTLSPAMDRYVSCERRRTSVRLRKNEQFPEESEQRQTAHKKNAYFPGYTCCQSSLVETSEPSKAFLIPKRIDSDFEINTSVSRCRERQCWHFRNCTVYLSFPRKERHLLL